MKKFLFVVFWLIFAVTAGAVDNIPRPVLKADTLPLLKKQVKFALNEKYEHFEIIYSGNDKEIDLVKSGNPYKEEYYSPYLIGLLNNLDPITEYDTYQYKYVWHDIYYHNGDSHYKGRHIHIIIGTQYEMTKQQQIDAEESLKLFLQKIAPKIKNKRPYHKIKIIHDEIAKQITYYNNGNTSYSIYGALIENRAVCMGYALLFKRICDYFNISSSIVVGDVLDSSRDSRHMWNMVQVNNRWYHIDITWDDSKDKIKYDYFLVSDEFMKSKKAGTRQWDKAYLYPPSDSNF